MRVKKSKEYSQQMYLAPDVSRTDDELMSHLAAGEMVALAHLYERHNKLVGAAICRSVPELPEAELQELVQDVFLALYESATRYSPGADLRGWIYGIAVKKAKLWRRRTWVHRRLLGLHCEENVGMALRINTSPARRTALRQVIVQQLYALPSDQREVLMMRAVEGYSGEEISKILKIKHDTVRTRLHRARKKMLDRLDEKSLNALLGEYK